MGIYGVMVLVDILAMSLGVGGMFVSMLSWERSGIRWLRDLALVAVAGTVYLMLDLLRLYQLGVGWPPAVIARIFLAILSGTGNLVLGIAIPGFVESIAPVPEARIARIPYPVGMVLLVASGILDEAFDVPVLHILNDAAMVCLLIPAAILLGIGYRRIAEPATRSLVRRIMWLTIASILFSRGQLLLTSLLGVPLELRRVRIVQVFYYLGVLGVLLTYSARYLFQPSGAHDFQLSRDFVERHGISKREGEIITMIVQGHPNRLIGERLSISDRTVKNHVSSIYRKTGAANKVQLLNMIRDTGKAGMAAGTGEEVSPDGAGAA